MQNEDWPDAYREVNYMDDEWYRIPINQHDEEPFDDYDDERFFRWLDLSFNYWSLMSKVHKATEAARMLRRGLTWDTLHNLWR